MNNGMPVRTSPPVPLSRGERGNLDRALMAGRLGQWGLDVKSGLVKGQRVDPRKLVRARELRKQMTHAEKQLWKRIRKRQLDGLYFRRQQILGGFIVDFYCDEIGLVIEVDGNVHAQQVEYDKERDEILKGLDLAVVRVTNDEVIRDPADAISRILTAANHRRRHRAAKQVPPLPPGEGDRGRGLRGAGETNEQ